MYFSKPSWPIQPELVDPIKYFGMEVLDYIISLSEGFLHGFGYYKEIILKASPRADTFDETTFRLQYQNFLKDFNSKSIKKALVPDKSGVINDLMVNVDENLLDEDSVYLRAKNKRYSSREIKEEL